MIEYIVFAMFSVELVSCDPGVITQFDSISRGLAEKAGRDPLLGKQGNPSFNPETNTLST